MATKFFDERTLRFAPQVEREHREWRDQQIVEMYHEGHTRGDTARFLRCSVEVVRAVLRAAGLIRPPKSEATP